MVVGALIFVLGIDLVKEVRAIMAGLRTKLISVFERPYGTLDIV